jgi:hypothetical protein
MQRPRHRKGVPGWRMDLEFADSYLTNQKFAMKLLAYGYFVIETPKIVQFNFKSFIFYPQTSQNKVLTK